jgi:tetraacyldisaccharide 4'-kinase
MGNNKYFILYPISLIYRSVTDIRNMLYNTGLLPSRKFGKPVICVGNITVGGTGKTPHTEYLAGLLQHEFRIAVLSRGYKRKSAGFQVASVSSTASDIGDEPLQIFRKYPDIVVAADRNRVNGVLEIMKKYPGTQVIILDDAFQHRRIKPGFTILLTDFNRLMTKDYVMPYGRLRETRKNCRRADVIVVTKTPGDISESETGPVKMELRKYFNGDIFFTAVTYYDPVPVFENSGSERIRLGELKKEESGAILVTGIVTPAPLKQYLQKFFGEISHLDFPDHHYFNGNDLERIISSFKNLKCRRRFVLTTAKDAVRLREFTNFAAPLKEVFYYIPTGIIFLNSRKQEYDNLILDYVRKNTGNN